MRTLLLTRHAEAASNVDAIVNGRPPGEGLSDAGVREAETLARALSGRRIELGVATRFRRSEETLRLALAGRGDVPTIVVPELDEIDFGSFEGGPLAAYRQWAWTHEPDARCPGGGESRVEIATRIAASLDLLLDREEETILVVGHSLPIRYVLDAADGTFPAAKIEQVAHATPFPLGRARVEQAAETLRVWAEEPQFRDAAEG